MKKEHLSNVQEVKQVVETQVSEVRVEVEEMNVEVQQLEEELLEAQLLASQREEKEHNAEDLERQIERVAE